MPREKLQPGGATARAGRALHSRVYASVDTPAATEQQQQQQRAARQAHGNYQEPGERDETRERSVRERARATLIRRLSARRATVRGATNASILQLERARGRGPLRVCAGRPLTKLTTDH